MMLFKINRFQLFESTEKTIRAKVGWPDDGAEDYDEDEETQDIEWDIQILENLDDVMILVEILLDNDFIRGDKIRVNPENLQDILCWESPRFNAAMKSLFEFRVDMVDDEKRTDYFFVHF